MAAHDPTAKAVLDRFTDLQGRRATWEAHWQEVADYGLGRREFSNAQVTPGRKRQTKIYDNTFQIAAGTLAAGLHSLMSIGRWFRLKLEDDSLNGIPAVRDWIEGTEKQLYNAFNRPEARFIPVMHEGYIDISCFGTGGAYIHDGGSRGAIFIPAPLSGLYLGENEEGRIDTYMWSRNLPAREIQRVYGQGALEVADKLVAQGKGDDPIRLLRAVFPNTDYMAGRIGLRGFAWVSLHIAEEDVKILRRGGYEEDPFAVARWDKEPGETYGRGPGIAALPSAKMLNEMNRSTVISAQKRTEPPVAIPSDGVISQLQLQPRGVSVVKSAYMMGNRPPIFELDGGGDPNIGVALIEMHRQSVRSAFHWELLQLIQQPYMTATHIERLIEIQQRVTSPILGRLQSELLEPAVERVFGIELRNGRLPPIPLELAGHRLRVEYISPVARAQKNFEANAVRRVLAAAAEYSAVDPSVVHLVDGDAALRVIAEAEGTPASVIRDAREVEALRDALRQRSEQQEQMQQLMALAEGAGKAAPALQAIQGGKAAA